MARVSRLSHWFVFAAVSIGLYLVITPIAMAQAVDADAAGIDAQQLAFGALKALKAHNFPVALGFGLVLIVATLRRFLTPSAAKRLPQKAQLVLAKIPDIAGMTFALLCSVLLAIGTSLVARHPITWEVIQSALVAGYLAGGALTVAKKALKELAVVCNLVWLYELVFPPAPETATTSAPADASR